MSKARSLADLGNVYDDGALSHRRMTYNGAMNVWQRGTSADTASNGDYMCDRWQVRFVGLDGNVDWDQETSSTPDEFAYALKISTDASETSLDAADILQVVQRFEGQDLQHLQKGTSGAKKLSLSFWVRSSVASTYTVDLKDNDNARTIAKSYSISTADTWEYKTLVFEGDTSDPLDNDANRSLDLRFYIDAGSNFTSGTFATAWQDEVDADRVYDTTGWLESTSPTFYITGVQLEVGDTATPFEHRSYGDELARCQRYFCHSNVGEAANEPIGEFLGMAENTTRMDTAWTFRVIMRDTPTITKLSDYIIRTNNNQTITSASFDSTNKGNTWILSTGSFTDKEAGRVYTTSTGAAFSADAEL